MSSAKWQRHSTFLSVRWRTWIGRALRASSAFLANVGVGWLASGNGSSGGCQHRPTGGGTPRKEGGLSARDMATPGQLAGSARTANGAVRDGC
jgi:hypothetical protein